MCYHTFARMAVGRASEFVHNTFLKKTHCI
uniref:Uncharacterized protein n=1 Tax=Rhizophora mucronata TaxID=61149 RepID=A0A2P2N940_RHIMU